jgi:hypothetical protein
MGERFESIEIAEAEKPPQSIAWLPLLFFRPRRFFPHFIVHHHAAVTVLLVWLWGSVSYLSRIDRQYERGLVPETETDSWAYFIGMVIGGGAVSGAIYYGLIGWWYRLRLRWSGATRPDPLAARRVLVYSKTVSVLPLACMYCFVVSKHATPLDLVETGSWAIAAAAPVFMGWSVVVSYIGVRQTFDLRALPATIWFLLLPGLIPVFVAVAVVFLWNSTSPIPPDVTRTQSVSHYGVNYDLPGNWTVNARESGPWDDGGGYTLIETRQDALLEIMTYPSLNSARAEMDRTLEEIPTYWDEVLVIEEYQLLDDGWSKATLEVRDRNTDWYTLTVFLRDLPAGFKIELRGTCLERELDTYKPGLDLLRASISTE